MSRNKREGQYIGKFNCVVGTTKIHYHCRIKNNPNPGMLGIKWIRNNC